MLRQINIAVTDLDNFQLHFNPGPLDLLAKYKVSCKSILHIGGHYAEEAEIYDKAGVDRAVFIEGDPKVFEIMQQKLNAFPKFHGICTLLSNGNSEIDFNIASNEGASSSILRPGRHLEKKPNVVFNETTRLQSIRLDSMNLGPFDLIVIDVQGAELLVIEGGFETIIQAQALWIELNAGSMYEGDADSSQIVTALKDYFVPVYMNMGANLWGDGLFIRKNR